MLSSSGVTLYGKPVSLRFISASLILTTFISLPSLSVDLVLDHRLLVLMISFNLFLTLLTSTNCSSVESFCNVLAGIVNATLSPAKPFSIFSNNGSKPIEMTLPLKDSFSPTKNICHAGGLAVPKFGLTQAAGGVPKGGIS